MVSNKTILVRVTKTQHERIMNNAQAKGHKTISSYIRSIALEHDFIFQEKFNELYNKVLNENPKVKEQSQIV